MSCVRQEYGGIVNTSANILKTANPEIDFVVVVHQERVDDMNMRFKMSPRTYVILPRQLEAWIARGEISLPRPAFTGISGRDPGYVASKERLVMFRLIRTVSYAVS
jgi:hypothetical protein